MKTSNKMLSKTIAILFLVAFIPSTIYSNKLFIKTIKTAYDTSSLKHASDQSLKSQKAKSYLTISDYLPSVKGSGELWQHNDELLNDTYKEQEFILEGRVTQSIVDIQKLTNIIEARKNLQIEKQNARIKNQNNLRELILLWVDFSHSRNLYNLAKYADSLASMHLEATEKRFESGDLTKTDIYQASSRYYSVHSRLERDSISFIQNTQSFYSEFGEIRQDLIEIPKFKDHTWNSKDIDSIIEDLPEINILKEKFKIAKVKLLNSASRNIPKLNAIGELSKNWDKSISYKPYPYTDMAIGLELSLPLWESGKTVAGIISAQALKKQEEILLNKEKKDKVIFIRNTFFQIDKYKSQLNNFQSSQIAAEKSLGGITIEFNIGNRNSMDVMDAQSELTNIKIEYEKSRKTLFLSYIDLLYALGILDLNTLSNYILQKDS